MGEDSTPFAYEDPIPYYTWSNGYCRGVLADDLDAEDPIGLMPVAIVDRIVAASYTP